VGPGLKPFVIAEAGVNHNGDLELAKQLIDAAKAAGADAVKFQTFKADDLVTPAAAQAEYQEKNIGRKETQLEMLKRLELHDSDYAVLKRHCDDVGIVFLSTPHSSLADIDLVARLCPAIKLASSDLTNLPFLRYAATKGLPLVISTGMSTLAEVREAVDAVHPLQPNVVLLHCTSNYPCAPNEANLRAMTTMETAFGLPVGYSDHTLGTGVALAAVALGAVMIEKHFTLDRTLPGPDHAASLEPHELRVMMDGIAALVETRSSGVLPETVIGNLGLLDALGTGEKQPTPSERKTMQVMRKSVVAAADIARGAVLTERLLAVKRPGLGIAPKHFARLVGRMAKSDVKAGALIPSDWL